MIDKEKQEAQGIKPLTMDDVKKMSKEEINENWDAVKEVINAANKED